MKELANDNKAKSIWQHPLMLLSTALFCNLLWGSAFPFIKIGYKYLQLSSEDTASILLYAGIRFTIAGILTVITGSIMQKKLLVPSRPAIPRVFILCLFQTYLQYLFFYIGLAHASGVNAAIINGFGTFFAILVACYIFRTEKMSANRIIGCLIGLAGIIAVALSGGSIGAFSINGEGFILLTALSYAFSSGFLKQFSKQDNTVMLSGWQFVFGGILLSVTGLAFGGKPGCINAPGIAILIWLSIVSAAAYTLWGILLKHNPISSVAVYGCFNPVFGTILSVILLHEGKNVGILIIIALFLVSLGIYICNKQSNNKEI